MLNLKTTLLLLASMGFLSTYAQDSKKEDQQAIKSMCGCFEVKFTFAETFSYPKDSSTYTPSQSKYENALEWVELVEDQPNKIALQHLLIVGNGPNDIVKHWRQDWLYQNTDFYMFYKDQNWKFSQRSPNEVSGQWTQKVYQVDDSPRYEGSSSWTHIDGNTYWLNVTDAPLPRREHTKRNDYNVLKRRNIHHISPKGWIHEQDNQKIIRDTAGNDYLLAQEKGIDTYTRVADSHCVLAQNWWNNNKNLWKKVRNKWERIYQDKKELILEQKVDKKTLYGALFDLSAHASQRQVDSIIDLYIKREKKM